MSVAVDSKANRTPIGIRVEGLTVEYSTEDGYFPAVKDASIEILPGTITGLIGESGSGKSTLAMALMNGVASPGKVTAGSVHIDGIGDILKMQGESLRRVRGKQMGFVFQASQNSLNPLKKVGQQILDLARSHGMTDSRLVLREAKMLAQYIGLDPDRVLSSYQHELSGGMRQRVGIIFALVLSPGIVILDEPTTALDMLSQSQVLEIIRQLHQERGLTTVLITHDIGVVAELADRVAVLYAGRVVEQGPIQEVLREPRHPYTAGLIHAIPRVSGNPDEARALPGSPPSLVTIPPKGCVFRDRCALKMPVCEEEHPPVIATDDGRQVACYAVNAHD